MQQIQAHLQELQAVLQRHQLWQTLAPEATAFESQQPFALDTMTATEWLQWIFIPRMWALLDSNAPLPTKIAISPYIEEALKEHQALPELLTPLLALEQLLNDD